MENFLGAIWKSVPRISKDGGVITHLLFGIVAKKSDGDESWRAYCGVVNPADDLSGMDKEAKDVKDIMKYGAKLTEEEARNWFPNIKLKYQE